MTGYPSLVAPRGSLAGIRVVEWGTDVTAPYCAKLLGDLDADVVKVEEPPYGDPARPRADMDPDAYRVALGTFEFLNGGKRSITLRVTDEASSHRFRRLLSDADILIHNQTARRISELGMDFASLTRANPRLVVTALTPFGATGPYRDWKACNAILSHLGNLARTTWDGMDPTTTPPMKPPGRFVDIVTGVAGAAATLGALMASEASGEPQLVDVSGWDAAFFCIYPQMMYVTYEGRAPNVRGPYRPVRAPMGYLPCGDGYLWVASPQPRHWQALTEILGAPDLGNEPLFSTPLSRADFWDVLEPILIAKLASWSKDDLFRACQERGVPVVPAYSVREAIRSEQVISRGSLVGVDHPQLGRIVMPGNPCRLSETPPLTGRRAPSFGEHTVEIDAERDRGVDRKTATKTDDIAALPHALPLSGVRVLDLSWVLAGPLCGQVLTRFGADVIKVESERIADTARVSPPFADGVKGQEQSGYHAALANGKRTLTVDFSKPAGLQVIKDLVRVSDVVLENFSPGTMERVGLGYDVLRSLRKDIILVSVSGLGQTGPLRSYRTLGHQIFALSGLSVLASPPGSPPAKLRGGGADPIAALYAALATLAALRHRRQTGAGQRIDLSMLEAALAQMPEAIMEVTLNGREPDRQGNNEVGHAPVGCYRCKGGDSWIAIAVHDDEEWAGLCRVLDQSAWIGDPRFRGPARRTENIAVVDRAISDWTRDMDPQAAMVMLQAAGVPAGVSYDDAQVLADPHFRARGFMDAVDHHKNGIRRVAGVPWKISSMPVPASPPRVPRMNEHNDFILGEVLGLSAEQIEQLRAQGVIPLKGAEAPAMSDAVVA
jgi:crotonobetainyl-CoA:carnitine CoA-transferase CaiB-like acyl-CoA transferase